MFKKYVALMTAAAVLAMTGCGSSGGTAPTEAAKTEAEGGAETGAQGDSAKASGKKMVIKLAHAAKDGSARDLGAEKIKEVVEEESGGRIEVQIYPNSQLGGGPDLIQGMQTNTIEMVILPSSFLGGFQPLTTLMDIPYLFPTDYVQLEKIEHGEAAEALRDTTTEIGVKTLDIWHTGYKAFTATSKLYLPSDFSGLKFRVMPSQILFKQYEALGATGVNMDFSECYNALQTGAIDGQENPLDTTTDMNFQEVQKYCTISNHGVLDQFIMASDTWYQSLSDEDKKIIMDGVDAGRQLCLEKTHEKEAGSRKILEEAGIEIHELSEEELSQWKEALSVCRDEYISTNGERGKELLEKFDAEIAALK